MPVTPETLLAEREWLRGLARALAASGAEAEDLEQETWLAALRAPPARPGPVRGWLATVLRRRAADARRADARRRTREEAGARPEAVPPAGDAVARAETHRRVLDAVLSLEEPGRTAVLLRFYEGLPPREIAARTGAPVETVRTRLRRALEALRERLDGEHGGRREAWVPVLLAFAREGEGEGTDPASPGKGAGRSRVPGPLAAAAVLAVAAASGWLGWALLRAEGGGGGPGAGGAAPPPVAAADPAGPEEPPAPPAPAPPAPTPSTRTPPPAPAPGPAREAVPAEEGKGLLVLRARAEPETPRFGERFFLVAAFENAGEGPLTFHAPDLAAGGGVFPEWRFRGADQALLAVAEGPGAQTMWHPGYQGKLVRLAPGESWTWREPVDAVLPAEGGPAAPLGPGTWTVSCAYAKPDDRVPWSETFGARDVPKPFPGLWTGTVKAEEFALVLLPGDLPRLTLSAAGRLQAGRPSLLEIAIRNTAARPIEWRGRLRLRSSGKGEGTLAEAFLDPSKGGEPADGREPVVLRVDAESTLRLRFDLARLPGDWMRPGGLMLTADFEPVEGGPGKPIASEVLFAAMAELPDARPKGLRLEARAGAGPVLELALRNASEATLRVPRDFGWPAALRVSVRRPGGGEGQDSWITVGIRDGKGTLSGASIDWTAGGRPRPLSTEDFAELRPGEAVAGTLDLRASPAPEFPPGTYQAVVEWRNPESGVRAGLEPDAVVAGRVPSEPVAITFP